jgi:xylose isomerase
VRESKDSKAAMERLVDAVNMMLEYHPKMRFAVEPKPNEPMDQAYIPTTGHAVALAYMTNDPARVGVNIESAHVILAGLDPSDEMGFALAADKLWTVHLNDQNGLKFDEDKSFGSVNLRRALNQVRVLDKHDFGQRGEWVGLDVKAMRTQKAAVATRHLTNSRLMFLALLEVSRSLSDEKLNEMIKSRDYEELDLYIMSALMGK